MFVAYHPYHSNVFSQKGLDLEICRSLKKRSLLGVNEHFSGKQSFEDDPLSQQSFVVRRG